MVIVELNEKAPRIKNKEISIDFNKSDLHLLCELLNKKLKEVKARITDEQTEMESVYNKEDFDMREVLADIYGDIESSILKESSLTITYEQFDVLEDVISEYESQLLMQLKKFGKTLLPDVYDKYIHLQTIQSIYMPEYQKAMKKLYPKRIKLHEKFSDYIEESIYNNCLISEHEEVTVHVPMREKDDLLQIIDNVLFKEDNGYLHSIMVLDDEVEITENEMVLTCEHFYKELSKDIYSGSKFKTTIKDYFIMKFIIESEEI